MNKTKIDWADMTWNPVTGCLHGCEYCYAEKITNRFGGYWDESKLRTICGNGGIHELEKPMYTHTSGKNRTKPVHNIVAPYPFGFDPTFHRYRLNEPQKIKKPQNIFVCSMADLFGEWVPDEWIWKVYEACGKANHHQYLFLTKNPSRYKTIYRNYNDYRCYMWFGATVTNQKDMVHKGYDLFEATGDSQEKRAKRFLSIEPLLGEIDKTTLENMQYMDWVIIGQQTGPGAVPPKPEWVQSIIDQCRAADVPVFVKSPLYEQFPIQEWPEGLRKEMGE